MRPANGSLSAVNPFQQQQAGHPGPGESEIVREVPAALSDLSLAIAELRSSINALFSRIAPVTSGFPSSEQSKGTKPSGMTTISQRILELKDSLDLMILDVQQIERSVQL